MGKKVEIKKTVFDRKGFQGVVDSKFKFFKEPEPVVDPDTVEELFRLYDKLYALVQIEGEMLSHQYLVERSSELYRIDTQLESIQPLLDEVASLRGQLLEGNRRILELETKLASGGEIDFESGEQMALLRTQLDTANSAIASLEMANSLANRATEEAGKASEEAAKKAKEAAEAAAKAAQEAQDNATADTSTITEIVKLFSKNRSSLDYAKKMLSDKRYYSRAFVRINNSWNYNNHWFLSSIKNYAWLIEDTGNRNYNDKYRYRMLFDNRSEARELTLSYVVKKLETAGYSAKEIVAAFDKLGNFKGNIRARVITYKSKDKEDKVGYTVIS